MIRLAIAIFVSVLPGVAWVATGRLAKGMAMLGLAIAVGAAYRLSGCFGPYALWAGLVMAFAFFVTAAIVSIRHLLAHKQDVHLGRTLAAYLGFTVTILVASRFVFAGNTLNMGANGSMTPVLEPGEFFYASKLARAFTRGDLVVYGAGEVLSVGYLCGLPGESVELKGTEFLVNGTVTECGVRRRLESTVGPLTLGPSEWFVLKNEGRDSGFHGPVTHLRGKVVFRFRDAPGGAWLSRLFEFYRPFSNRF